MRSILGVASLLIVSSAMAGPMQQPPATANNTISFLGNYIEVIGFGLPPADDKGPTGYPLARLSAFRDANRKVAEATLGIQIDSRTEVRNLGNQISDSVIAAVSARVPACNVMDTEEALRAGYGAQGYVTLRCRVDLLGSGGVMPPVMDIVAPDVKRKFDDLKLAVYLPPTTPATPTPAAAAVAAFDGLIVRLPATFKPSAFPTVRTDKGEVVYSIDNVPLEIQSSRGLVKLTNDISKAAALLKDMGSTTPLTVDGFLYTDTDAQVKPDDAAKIVNANKRTSFLSSARVIFVIGKPL